MTGENPARVVVLMIETTGLATKEVDRVVEIGAVEIVGREITGRRFHAYLNSGRPSDTHSLTLHGLTTEFLADKPAFPDIAEAFCDFIQDALLVAQPYGWTAEFLDYELALADLPPTSAYVASGHDMRESIQSLPKPRPHDYATLEDLCSAYRIGRPADLHGTLLDAHLAANVYLAMTEGRALPASQSSSTSLAPTYL